MQQRKDGSIGVTVHEMVTFSLLHYLGTAAQENAYPIRRGDEAARAALSLSERVLLSHEFPSGDYTFTFEGEADTITTEGRTDVMSLSFLVDSDPDVVDPLLLRTARGEAMILAYAAYKMRGRAPILAIIFYHPANRYRQMQFV